MEVWCQIVEVLESQEKEFNLDVVRERQYLKDSWRRETKSREGQPDYYCNNYSLRMWTKLVPVRKKGILKGKQCSGK